MDREFEATFDAQGHFDIPPDVRARHGFTKGTKVKIEERTSEIVIRADRSGAHTRKKSLDAIDKGMGMLGKDSKALEILLEERRLDRWKEDRMYLAFPRIAAHNDTTLLLQ